MTLLTPQQLLNCVLLAKDHPLMNEDLFEFSLPSCVIFSSINKNYYFFKKKILHVLAKMYECYIKCHNKPLSL